VTKAATKRPWLRAPDQWAAAALLVLGLGVIGANYAWRGGLRGELIEIETAAPRPAQYWVDLNSAKVPDLLLLPDVGESLARRIVEHRDANGPFRDHNDLLRVRGIGPKTLERISPYLRPMPRMDATVEGATPQAPPG
jgi:competence protein ComEA